MKNLITAGICILSAMVLALYFRNTEDELQLRLKNILSGLLMTDKKHEINYPRVAVGYGSCMDVVFNGKDIIQCSEFEDDRNSESINSFDDLQRWYSYFFQHGAAAERYTSNATLFNELVTQVSNLESSRIHVGGNAACMARRFALEGFDVLLASSTSEAYRQLFPENMNFVGETTSKDDIHLVFEYQRHEQCGPFIAPRANRFILHHDYHNPRVTSLEKFEEKLKTFRPHLFVVGGLQMMDNYPLSKAMIQERMMKIGRQMRLQAQHTKIHFEMASIADKHLLSQIFDYVIPFADSLGMNEQELSNIYSLLKYKTVTLAVESNPKIRKTLDMMRQVHSLLHESINVTAPGRSVSRLHVHTLAYQVIMISNKSAWKNTHAAAARASLVANTYVCDTPEVDIDKSMLVMDDSFSVSSLPGSRRIYLDDQKPVACWDENLYHICIAPNLVCTNAKQTAGCGDNISAAGLAAQL